MTKEQLEQAVQNYFGDTSRPASQTKSDLLEIAASIEMMCEGLPDQD